MTRVLISNPSTQAALSQARGTRPRFIAQVIAGVAVLASLEGGSAIAADGLRVVDREGRPVAGARVVVFVEGGPTAAFAVAERPLDWAVTGDDGLARIRVPVLDGVAVIVDHADYGPVLLEGPRAHGAKEVRIESGEVLTGWIEIPGAEPIAIPEGAKVCARGRFHLRMGGESRQWNRCAAVAPDGVLTLTGLPEGPLAVEVLVPGQLRLHRTVESRENLRFSINGGVPVAGLVADPHGRPVSGARIETEGAVPAETGSDGRFAVAVPRIPATLKVSAPGFREQIYAVKASGGVEIRLEPTERIVATLLGEPGYEISEVEVWFTDVTPGSRQAGRRTLETESGELRLDLPGPGRYLLRLLVHGYRGLVHPPVEVGPGQATALGAIQLSRGAGVHAVLLDAAEGTPLSGVMVDALPVGGIGMGMLQDGRGGEGEVSDETGDLTLAGLDLGRYHVRWRRDGYATIHRLVDLESQGLLELGTIYLDGGVVLHGKLSDRDGEARPGLAVCLFDAANEVLVPFAETTSDAEGEYRLEPVGAGRYRVQVAGERLLLAQEIEIASGPPEQRLDLQVGGVTLSGRLTYRGLPLSGGVVTLTPAFERRANVAPIKLRSGDEWLSFGRPPATVLTELGNDGSFTLEDVSPGLAWLATGGAEQRRFLRSLMVPDRADAEVEIELEGHPLEGGVVDAATGLGLRAEVWLLTVTGVPFERTETAPDGAFRFDDLESGQYEIEARADGRLPTPRREVRVSDVGPPQVIELEPSGRPGSLEVVFRRTDGTLARDVPPVAIDSGGRRSPLRQIDGDRVVAELPAGEYGVAWSDPLHGAGVSAPVHVGPGRRPLVERLLTAGASVILACPAHRCANAPVEVLTVHSPDGTELTSMLSGIMPSLRFSAAGDLSIGRLSPGSYVFRLWVDGEQWERKADIGTGEIRVSLP